MTTCLKRFWCNEFDLLKLSNSTWSSEVDTQKKSLRACAKQFDWTRIQPQRRLWSLVTGACVTPTVHYRSIKIALQPITVTPFVPILQSSEASRNARLGTHEDLTPIVASLWAGQSNKKPVQFGIEHPVIASFGSRIQYLLQYSSDVTKWFSSFQAGLCSADNFLSNVIHGLALSKIFNLK